MRPRSTYHDRRFFVSPGENSIPVHRGRASCYPYPSYNVNNSFSNQFNYDSPSGAYTDYGENFISFESYQEFDDRSFQLRNIPEDPYARSDRRQWTSHSNYRKRSTELSNSVNRGSNSNHAPPAEAPRIDSHIQTHIKNKYNDTPADKLSKNGEKARQEFPSHSSTFCNKNEQLINLKDVPSLPNDRIKISREKCTEDTLNINSTADSEVKLAPVTEQSGNIKSVDVSSNFHTSIKREEDDMSVSSTATIEGPDANRTEEEFEKFVACKGKIEGEDRLPGHYVNIALYLKDIPEKGMDIEEWAHSTRTSTPLPPDCDANFNNVLKTPKTPNDAKDVLNCTERSINIKETSARASHSASRSCKRHNEPEKTKKELLDATGRNDKQSRIHGKEAKMDEHKSRSGVDKTRLESKSPYVDRSKSYDLKSEKIKMGIKDIRESSKNRHEPHSSNIKLKNYEDKCKKNNKDSKNEIDKARQPHGDKLSETILESIDKNSERRISSDNKYENKSTRTIEYDSKKHKRKNEECSKQHKKVFISSIEESVKRSSEVKAISAQKYKERNSHSTDEIRVINPDQKAAIKFDEHLQSPTCSKSNLIINKPSLNGGHALKPELKILSVREPHVKRKLESRVSSHRTKANSDTISNHMGSNNDSNSSKMVNNERCEKKKKAVNKDKEVSSEKRVLPNKETILKGDVTLHKNRGDDKSTICNKNDSLAQQEINSKIKVVPIHTRSRGSHNVVKQRDHSNLKRNAKITLSDHNISGRLEEPLQKDASNDIDPNTKKLLYSADRTNHIDPKPDAVNIHVENITKAQHIREPPVDNHEAKINYDADDSFTESECNVKLSAFQASRCEKDEDKRNENSKKYSIIKTENLGTLETITNCKELISIKDKPGQIKDKIHNIGKSEMNNETNVEPQRELNANNNSNSIIFSLDPVMNTTSAVEILKETSGITNMEIPPKSVIQHTNFVRSENSEIVNCLNEINVSNNPADLNAELPGNIMSITQKTSDFYINSTHKDNSFTNRSSRLSFHFQNEKIHDVTENNSGIKSSYIPNVKANDNLKSEVVLPLTNANESILNGLNEHKTFTCFILHLRNMYEDLFNYQHNILLARQSSLYDIELYVLDADFNLMKTSREHRMINEFVRLVKMSNLDMRIMCDNLFIHHVYCRLLSIWRTNWRCPSETDIKGSLEALYAKAQNETISLCTTLTGCDNIPYKDDLLVGSNAVYHKAANDPTRLQVAMNSSSETSYNHLISTLDTNPINDGKTTNDNALLRQMLASPPRNSHGCKIAFEEVTTPIIKQSHQSTPRLKIDSVFSLYEACNAQNKESGSIQWEKSCATEVVSQNMPVMSDIEIIDLTQSPELSQIKSSSSPVSNEESSKELYSSFDASRPKSNDSGFVEEVPWSKKTNALADAQEQKIADTDQENSTTDDEERRVIYCMLCNDVAELRCSKCHWACYCSVICQEKHWGIVHMFACKSPTRETS